MWVNSTTPVPAAGNPDGGDLTALAIWGLMVHCATWRELCKWWMSESRDSGINGPREEEIGLSAGPLGSDPAVCKAPSLCLSCVAGSPWILAFVALFVRSQHCSVALKELLVSLL